MKIWRMLAAICMISALVFTFAACGGNGATETPTTEATDATTDATEDVLLESKPLVDPETFKSFIGTWYADGSSAGYRIIIQEDATWDFTDASQETIFGGSLYVNEDDTAITLYDPDGVQALDLKLEEAGKVYVEIYMESLMDSLSTNYFLNEITNDNADYAPLGDEDTSVVEPSEEHTSDEVTTEEPAA